MYVPFEDLNPIFSGPIEQENDRAAGYTEGSDETAKMRSGSMTLHNTVSG